MPLTQISTILPDLSSLFFSIHTFYLGVSNKQRALQPLFFWFLLVMKGMMKRPRGTSKMSSLTIRVQLSDALSAIFSETNKNKRRKNWIKTISWHHYSKFPPFLPLCVFLSLSPGTITKPWLERSHDFLPESHSIPSKYSADIVKTSFV